MSNAALNFLRVLKRTIKGDPYPALQGQSFKPILYRVANVTDPLVGVTLSGRYLVSQRIGCGSMSIVYSAVQNPIDRTVAIKMLKREFLDEPLTVKRFYLEATAVSKLKHQNILTIHDVDETDDGVPYFVMEFLEGVSLAQLVEKYGAIHYLRALPIFAQIASAMAHSHRQGMIHRDLKPSNIMLTEEDGKQDFVKLVDFGIVLVAKKSQKISQRLTQKGEIWGSPFYMSPEQCTGANIDLRSDIYSMGMVMYEILVGRPAFEEKNIGRIVNKHLKEMPLRFVESAPGKAIPETVEEIVFRCVQKNPDKRYQTMEELEMALQQIIPRRSTSSQQRMKPSAGQLQVSDATNAPRKGVRETTTELQPPQSGEFSGVASNSHGNPVRNKERRDGSGVVSSGGRFSDTQGNPFDEKPLDLGRSSSESEDRQMQGNFEDAKVEELGTRKKSFEEVKDSLRSQQPEQKSNNGIYVLIASAVVILLLFFGGIGFALTKALPQFGDLGGLINSLQTNKLAPSGAGADSPVLRGTVDTPSNLDPSGEKNEQPPNNRAEANNQGQQSEQPASSDGSNSNSDANSAITNTSDENSGVTTAGVTLSGKPVTYPSKNTADNSQNPARSTSPYQTQTPVEDTAGQMRANAPTQPQRKQVAPAQRNPAQSTLGTQSQSNPVRINRKKLTGPSDDDQIEQLYLKKKKHRGDAQQQWHDYSDSERIDDD